MLIGRLPVFERCGESGLSADPLIALRWIRRVRRRKARMPSHHGRGIGRRMRTRWLARAAGRHLFHRERFRREARRNPRLSQLHPAALFPNDAVDFQQVLESNLAGEA